MKAKLVVFPIRGRSWCFSRSIDQATSQSASVNVPSTVTDLWKKISSDSKPINANAELLVDFISNKVLHMSTFVHKCLTFFIHQSEKRIPPPFIIQNVDVEFIIFHFSGW